VHAIGGIVGNILTGIFAQKKIAALDGTTVIHGGWLDRHWVLVGWQIANSLAGFVWSFSLTVRESFYFYFIKSTHQPQLIILCIMWGISKRFGIPIDIHCDDERAISGGIDEFDMGEYAYDYVEHEREIEDRQKPASGTVNTGNAAHSVDIPMVALRENSS
jgi:Amt family ammonium transporter